MKTLASFKRDLKNVKSLTMIDSYSPNKLIGVEREIAYIDTVQFALLTNGRKSYVYFPKAKYYSFNESENTFKIDDEQGDFITYKINTKHNEIISK